MTTVQTDIAELEERLRRAELGPDPHFFQEVLADDAVLVAQDGSRFAKSQVVEAHQPGSTPKFTRVDMTDVRIVDHGAAAVVTCQGVFERPGFAATLRFMRVWLKKDGRWQIVAASVSG